MKSASLLLTAILYFLADYGVFKKGWMPDPIREILFISKYDNGDCLVHSKGYWGRERKRVLGVKFHGEKEYYLLKDLDRHGLTTLQSKGEIEYLTNKVQC